MMPQTWRMENFSQLPVFMERFFGTQHTQLLRFCPLLLSHYIGRIEHLRQSSYN
jgi:hypothetical protein